MVRWVAIRDNGDGQEYPDFKTISGSEGFARDMARWHDTGEYKATAESMPVVRFARLQITELGAGD
jgi:hypothetical protein